MTKTVVYLPEDLKADLERVARDEGRSEEELILEGVRRVVDIHRSPAPRIPLFSSGDPTLAERISR
ncbi:MAG TPA: CopG family transcriptional regulator [Thermoanaerobaculia bacterium]